MTKRLTLRRVFKEPERASPVSAKRGIPPHITRALDQMDAALARQAELTASVLAAFQPPPIPSYVSYTVSGRLAQAYGASEQSVRAIDADTERHGPYDFIVQYGLVAVGGNFRVILPESRGLSLAYQKQTMAAVFRIPELSRGDPTPRGARNTVEDLSTIRYIEVRAEDEVRVTQETIARLTEEQRRQNAPRRPRYD